MVDGAAVGDLDEAAAFLIGQGPIDVDLSADAAVANARGGWAGSRRVVVLGERVAWPVIMRAPGAACHER